MAEDLIVCPNCGLEVSDGKYCKYCGELLHPEKEEGQEDSDSSQDIVETKLISEDTTSEVLVDVEEHLPDFGFHIDGMDPRDMARLFSKSELDVLDKELDSLIEQIRATRHALDLKHADKELLTERAENLKERLMQTKNRRQDLRKVKGILPIKRIFDELEEHESKLSKLEGIEKKLDPEVFEEEKTRILIKIRDLRRGLKTAIKVSKTWLKSMNEKLKNLRKERSRLEAKLKIGDISTANYDSKKSLIDRFENVILGGHKMLDEMITLASKK